MISLYKPSIAYTLEAIMPLCGSIIVRLPAYVSCGMVAIMLCAFGRAGSLPHLLSGPR